MVPKAISVDTEKRRRAVFNRAVLLPDAERIAFIERETKGDPDLRAAVLRLVAASASESAGVLDRPVHSRRAGPSNDSPSSIGGFAVIRCLGRGGMGSVYLCRNPRGGLIAIKLLNFELQTQAFLQRFENERLIQSRLEHPNVCRLLSAGETEHGSPFIAMEYIEGAHIDAYCRRSRFTPAQRLRLFSQVLAAVNYFHQQQIVHRDLKPSNILVDSAGKVKILDFGVARIVEHQIGLTGIGATSTKTPIMTIRYASPEQLTRRVSGRSSDIYSLGVMLYELLAGQHPFASELQDGQDRLAAAMAARTPAAPSRVAGARQDISEKMDRMVMKALRFDPGKRYVSASQFHDDLRACIEAAEGQSR